MRPQHHYADRPENAPVYRFPFIRRVLYVLVSVFAMFLTADYLTAALFQRFGGQPTEIVAQVTSIAIGLLFLLTARLLVGRFARPQLLAFWHSLIDMVRQMANGNFNVHINVDQIREPSGDNHPFRQLVHSINHMAEELAQMEQMRQEFISNVSHEIQSPLTSITGFVQALKSDALSQEQRRHYLNIIESESKRLSRLSDNLLKLTSLESGYHPFSPEAYRLDRQIRDVVIALEPVWLKKAIQIEVDVPPALVHADKDLINQVWVNLLSNAIKFTPENGTIALSGQMDDSWISIDIKDTGIGMHAEDIERIFERFYKVDKARSEGGSGLGLAIVQKIVDMHHGEIRVDSTVGSGTTFTVRIPSVNQTHA